MKKLLIGTFALLAAISVAVAQQGYWPNWPIVGGAAYCSSYTNAVCTNTVPAGPTAFTGSEQMPANSELANGQSPQNVLISVASLGKGPISYPTTGATPAGISASNLSGGVIYTHSGAITLAQITLPQGSAGVVDGQTYRISANRTITTLSVAAASGDTIAANSSPTTLTASLTAPQGYTFVCAKSGTACTWWRLQ